MCKYRRRDGILLIKGNANKHANGPLLKKMGWKVILK